MRATYTLDETLWGEYVVAFVDILGQREQLAKVTRLPESEDEESAFRCAAQRTYEAVRVVKTCLKPRPPDGLAEGTEEDREFRREVRQELAKLSGAEIGIHFFGDSFTLYAPLFNHRQQPVISNVWPVIDILARGMILCLAARIPLRGGVELGVGAAIEGGGVYGQAVVSAYRLESETAQYPRLVVGNELMSRLSSLAGAEVGRDPLRAFNKGLARVCLQRITTDSDGARIVDYLGHSVQSHLNGSSPGTFAREVYAGSLFAAKEYERFVKSGDSKLAWRYLRLKDYCARRASIWGVSPP